MSWSEVLQGCMTALLVVVLSVLVVRRVVRRVPVFGIIRRSVLPSTQPLFWADVELISSTRTTPGTLQFWERQGFVSFLPKEFAVFGEDDVLVIPLTTPTSLYQTFAPIEWDARNTIAIHVPANQSVFQTL